MARTTFVKSAQQRYHTKPVLDENGEQVKTPVMKRVKDRETGEVTEVQKTSKRGPVFMRVTVADKSRPKPNLKCDFSGCKHPDREIKPGQAYKHITPKSGPYSGYQRNRHAEHPGWQVWEYSSSLSARLAQVSFNFEQELEGVSSAEDVEQALSNAAEEIKSIAEEKRESASNIEEGFGHPTSSSEELEQIADDLESWADEVESADVPEYPEPEEGDCENCGGSGKDECSSCGGTSHEGGREEDTEPGSCPDCKDGQVDCSECEGEGTFTPEEPTDEQIDEWRDAVRDAVSIVDESPV